MRASCGWLVLALPCLLLPGAPKLARIARPVRAAGAQPLDESSIERARDAVAASEYEVRPNARGLQAPNRSNGLRTYFSTEGVSLQERGGLDAPALLGAALSADAQTRCRVLGRTGGCTILQVTAIRRAIASPSLSPIQSGPAAQFCVAALGS